MNNHTVRIGIITLSASDNCGSLLQCYALKKVLSSFGQVDVINYVSRASHQYYDIFPSIEGWRDWKRILFRIKALPRLLKDKTHYRSFRSHYLSIGRKEVNSKILPSEVRKYDVIVVGSDQVWNVTMGDYSDDFFLPSVSLPKIAYAPSLGGRSLQCSPLYSSIIDWLKDFSAISSRESFGCAELEKATGFPIPKVLDPTLLINKRDWLALVGPPIISTPYIFYYSWSYKDHFHNVLVSSIAQRKALPVYVMDERKWVFRSASNYSFKCTPFGGPLGFLNLMYYAEECYVESFHGVIFAYLFNKCFWLIDDHIDPDDRDTRLQELVNLLKIEERVIVPNTDISIDDRMTPSPNTSLVAEQESSLEFLEKAFEEILK